MKLFFFVCVSDQDDNPAVSVHEEFACLQKGLASHMNRCHCKHNDGQPCKTLFTEEQMSDFRLEHASLDSNELDMILLGKIAAWIHV